jgi:hypothetical protein
MVFATSMKYMACLAALLLAAGAVHADVITGAGPGAGPGGTVKPGGKGEQKGGVSVAAGDITGDGKDAPKEPLPLTTPISKPGIPDKPIARQGNPKDPKPMPQTPANIKARQKPQEALLLPAVQKVRDPAAHTKPVAPITPIPSTGPIVVKAPLAKPQPLLVPAVQKVRESATRAK